jgi:hypothetical protein
MIFTPIVLTCLIAAPTQCRPIMGPAEPTEVACMDSLSTALSYVATRTDIYVAGLTCIQTHLLGESASTK